MRASSSSAYRVSVRRISAARLSNDCLICALEIGEWINASLTDFFLKSHVYSISIAGLSSALTAAHYRVFQSSCTHWWRIVYFNISVVKQCAATTASTSSRPKNSYYITITFRCDQTLSPAYHSLPCLEGQHVHHLIFQFKDSSVAQRMATPADTQYVSK